MYSMPDATSKLDAIKREATKRGGGVLLRMRELTMVSTLAGIRHSALMFIFVYLPLQIALLYDFHVLNLIEKWQQKYGKYARDWFTALGEFEALSSLAALAYDYPAWALPRVDQSECQYQASGIGHPLLPDDARVANDVQVGPAGAFLLVTGSNMSGKSTLLRTIGVNTVLAQAGAPVCARQLLMPPVMLATSMRIHDSLESGVSFYMAELMRLKSIVDMAAQFEKRSDRTLLYLLDEILQGTNSKERHIAVVRVLHHLLQHGAIGAVSTHDLELARSQPLTKACHAVHFRETLHDHDADQPMTFDYRLRPGVATTSNALKLLEIVGLGEDAE
jgi:DNA mismatch repair ATPase MutS